MFIFTFMLVAAIPGGPCFSRSLRCVSGIASQSYGSRSREMINKPAKSWLARVAQADRQRWTVRRSERDYAFSMPQDASIAAS